MGIKIMTLAHASVYRRKVRVASRNNEEASVEFVEAPKDSKNLYGYDFVLTFADGKKFKVYLDQFLRAHILDDKGEELTEGNVEEVPAQPLSEAVT